MNDIFEPLRFKPPELHYLEKCVKMVDQIPEWKSIADEAEREFQMLLGDSLIYMMMLDPRIFVSNFSGKHNRKMHYAKGENQWEVYSQNGSGLKFIYQGRDFEEAMKALINDG